MAVMMLYHGTAADNLPGIFANGIRPRGQTKGNWESSVKSNAATVYLTLAYPFHFAAVAADGRDLAVLEVDRSALDEEHLVADEDAIEQSMRGRDRLPKDWNIKRRTIYYRSRAHLFSPEASLAALGTVGYRGTVPKSALRRAVTVPAAKVTELIIRAHDPSICLLNYQLLGDGYRGFVAWLFGDLKVCPTNPRIGLASEHGIFAISVSN